ncbi:MAG: type II CRISPR RNA-guided endonuclease Cas9 [Bacteroidales bacterium]|nr:type II CRISPR RNA-guided endonuclease Cas9 [Bacteroidales bacterium]
MKRILGLDLGTNSIGWAVVNEAENANEKSSIVKLGVRAIHFDTFVNSDTGKELKGDASDFFKSGKGVSPNAGRTQKRGARRNLQRYKLRRENLIEIFRKNNIITDESVLSENGNFSTFETFRLRAKAATQEVSLEHFARILLMINKKRGYKSNRKAKDGEEGSLIDGMEIAKKLYDEDLTPGQLGYEILSSGKNHLPDFYSSDLQCELDRIWNFQSKFYPDILTESLKKEIEGKNASQTWAVLQKHFVWKECVRIWDNDQGCNVEEVVEKRISGIKRSVKGRDLKLENYKWRVESLEEKFSLEELAIVFQEINKQKTSTSGYLGAISDRSKNLYFNRQTVGQYLMSLIEKDSNISLKNLVFYRQDYLDEFNTIWETQAKYHKELTPALKKEIRDCIIFYQRRLKSQKNLISFCELESQEKVVSLPDGKEKKIHIGSRVIPRSSPLFQEFKIWQTLNNVEIFGRNVCRKKKRVEDELSLFSKGNSCDPLFVEGRRKLYPEEMEILAKELSVKEKMGKQEILSLLFEHPENLDMNYKAIDGNRTGYALFKAYSDIIELTGHSPISFRQPAESIISQVREIFESLDWKTDFLEFDSSRKPDTQKYYKLWHLLYSFESDNTPTGNGRLINKIKEWTGIEKEYASILTNVTFLEDYGSLSAKAIANILPYLKEGNGYDIACHYAGYNHSKSSLTKEQIENKQLKNKLEILPKNSLRNPIVEKILNQMVNVVNAIIDSYGRPDEIRVELARDLKKNADERSRLTKAIEETTKLHDNYRKILKEEFGLSHITRNDIIRYKLYEELKDNGYKTLYSNTYIPKEKLFTGEYDIEHIIPKARLFDDSTSNKTLELRSINIEKGKQTAYDFVLEKYGEMGLDAYINRCEALFKGDKYKSKLKKLLMKESDIPEDFIERDLRNTQYIARFSLKMLSDICKRVIATTGSITDKLREDWQLVDMMKELNWGKYEALGMIEYSNDRDGRKIGHIKDWSKRNDHRHHAMDALTVAFTKDVFIQYFNNVNASQKANTNEYAIKNKYFLNGRALPPIPLDEFRKEARKHMQEILISIKPKGKTVTKNITRNGENGKVYIQQTPRGQLHLDTVYGKIKRYATKEVKVNGSLTLSEIEQVAKQTYRMALIKRLEEYGGDSKKAFSGKNAIDKNPIWLDDLHTKRVPEKVKLVFFEDYYTIRKTVDKDLNIDKVIDARLKKLVKERGKEGLSNIEENPLWQNEQKGIPVKRVKITGISNAVAIHDKKDKFGNLILDGKGERIPVDFVNTGNNHHVAIYRKPVLNKDGSFKVDNDGNKQYELEEVVVSFYEAVTRANNGLPVIDKNFRSNEGWEFLYSMKQNEYFVFPNEETGFDPREIDLMDPENYSIISPNLFRLQKMSKVSYGTSVVRDYMFRHHLESVLRDSNELKDVVYKQYKNLSFVHTFVKVRINHIGQIVKVGEN